MKINANARKNKRARKKNRSDPGKGEIIKTEPENSKKDSLTYNGGRSAGICRETKLVIFQRKQNRDTILVYFPRNEGDMSDDKKRELKEYIEKAGADEIIEIIIKNCHDKNVLTEHEILWLNERARKITKYFKKLNVPKAKIRIEE